MGAPYSQDLRERVISVVDGGMGAYEAAPLRRVSVSYIYKALRRRPVRRVRFDYPLSWPLRFPKQPNWHVSTARPVPRLLS